MNEISDFLSRKNSDEDYELYLNEDTTISFSNQGTMK